MLTAEQLKVLELYNKGLSQYKARQWKAAMALFEEALKVDPNDGPSKLYLTRSQEYEKNPPGDDWDGVFVMKTK